MTTAIDQPTALATMVETSAGSVTSRVLLRNGGGVMTVFAFAQGEGLTEHSTPHEATLLLLEGSLRITVGETDHQMTTGDILHLPAAIPHTLHGGEPFKMLLTLFKEVATG